MLLIDGTVLIDEALEGALNPFNVEFVFIYGLAGYFFELGPIQGRVIRNQVVLYFSDGCGALNVQEDELIRDNAYLLKRQGLHLSPGEALNDPALVLLFVLHNLFLYNINNNIIINCGRG